MRHLRHLPWLALLVVVFTACGADPEGSQPDPCNGIVADCAAAADCAGEATCDACGRCVPLTCSKSSDCPGDLACIEGVCADAVCTSNGDCDDGFACVDGACVTD